MKTDYDIAIVGSGFGGSILAMIACRLGLRVALVERGSHPRFAIGESTSPLLNLIIEQIADRYDLPQLKPLSTYGMWRKAYPEVMRGLKRGFTYYHHELSKPFAPDPDRRRQLLVAASPHDELGDTHWLRSDVDEFLMKLAVEVGADYLDHTEIAPTNIQLDSVTLQGNRKGVPVSIRARLLVDATGPRGLLHRAGLVAEQNFAFNPPTQALFTHFTGVERCADMDAYQSEETPPYPPDAAALHHVFDGGWIWVLRFDNGVTSAGVAMESPLADQMGLSEREAGWKRLMAALPTVGEQFRNADPIHPWIYAPKLTCRADRVAGDSWVLLPSAAAFVDPLFSTGMPLTLLGIERLARALEQDWDTERLAQRLEEYGRTTLEEADYTAAFIAGHYAAFRDFPMFAAYTMFYFAAASFSEMSRRLDRGLVSRYLAADHPTFGADLLQCGRLLSESSVGDTTSFYDRVRNAIEPLNIAGLCDSAKRNWYGVDLNDVVRGAPRLGFTPEEMQRILSVADWAQIPREDEQTFHTSITH